MKLKVFNREHGKRGQLSAVRHEDHIPAVLYIKNGENKVISVDGNEFMAILRSIKKGFLSTTVFDLEIDGKKVKAIVKDIQYHRTTYDVLHLDFQELYDDMKINVNVPLEFIGSAECIGIKLGGFLRPVMRSVKVRCFPKDIPESFMLDISKLGIKQTKRIRDLALKEGVTILADKNNVLAVIAK
ncbi:MAG: 50S ribosomal protein L25/general stress protein Ctc [Simkaniaceae bacterium]|nr:50S ribosomal protein L25/general stress protein Ctc [Simkaniaceae bacterium]